MAVDGPATRPSQTATRHRTTRSRKLLSGVVGCEAERQAIESENLYDGHRPRLHAEAVAQHLSWRRER